MTQGARVVGVAGNVELGVEGGGVRQPVARPCPVHVVGGGGRVHVPPRRRPVHGRHVHLRRRLEPLGSRVGGRHSGEGPGLVVTRHGGNSPVHAAEAGCRVVAQSGPVPVHLLQEGRLHSNNTLSVHVLTFCIVQYLYFLVTNVLRLIKLWKRTWKMYAPMDDKRCEK